MAFFTSHTKEHALYSREALQQVAKAVETDPEHHVWLHADGDELEVIRHRFSGIPMSNGRVVIWYGAVAKFIMMNY